MKFVNKYKKVVLSERALWNIETNIFGATQHLDVYRRIIYSLNRIAGGWYDGIQYVGKHTWKKDVDFADCTLYLTLVVSRDYQEVEFCVTSIVFHSFTVTESQLRRIIREAIRKIIA